LANRALTLGSEEQERGTKFTTATMAKAEEVSERTRWNDPADRIVSAYVSLAEGNICVMACESYVTQERIARLPLLLSVSLSLSLLLLGPSSVRGTEVTARSLPPAEQAANRRKNIFFFFSPCRILLLAEEIAPIGLGKSKFLPDLEESISVSLPSRRKNAARLGFRVVNRIR